MPDRFRLVSPSHTMGMYYGLPDRFCQFQGGQARLSNYIFYGYV